MLGKDNVAWNGKLFGPLSEQQGGDQRLAEKRAIRSGHLRPRFILRVGVGRGGQQNDGDEKEFCESVHATSLAAPGD